MTQRIDPITLTFLPFTLPVSRPMDMPGVCVRGLCAASVARPKWQHPRKSWPHAQVGRTWARRVGGGLVHGPTHFVHDRSRTIFQIERHGIRCFNSLRQKCALLDCEVLGDALVSCRHYEESARTHRYALELHSACLWDYKREVYVHRVGQASGLASKGDQVSVLVRQGILQTCAKWND